MVAERHRAVNSAVTFSAFQEHIIGMRDTDLLKHYLQSGSEPAFAELVNQYVNLAYAVAQRQLRDPNLAKEVVK